MMRILIVLEYFFPHIGGIETVFWELTNRYQKMGHEVNVVTMRLPGTKKIDTINGIKIHRISVPFSSRFLFDTLFSIPIIFSVAKKSDLIHSSDYITAFPSWIVGKILRKPLIVTIHEPIGKMWHNTLKISYLKGILFYWLEKILIWLPFDHYVCVSYYSKNCLRFMGKSDEKIITIYNGVDQDLFNKTKKRDNEIRESIGIAENQFLYFYYGRPGITKGVEYLIEAVPLIEKVIPNSKLLILLSKDPKEKYLKIKKRIDELNSNNHIILKDSVPRDTLPKYICACNCVVVPSLTEGFGFTAAESCAMGVPIVATNIGSLPEVVSGYYYLIEPSNSDAIVNGLVKIYSNKGMISPEKIFSWDRSVQEYINLYHNLLKTDTSVSE